MNSKSAGNEERQLRGRPTFTSPTNPRWTEEFNMGNVLNGWRWNSNRTSAFFCQNHNPGWGKLDFLQSNSWHLREENHILTIVAAKSDPPIILENGNWSYNTGLLTTEYSTEEFMVKTDNYIETRIQLPSQIGAWPALFTWKPDGTEGANEVDVFEYHPTNLNILELTSHLNGEVPCFFKRNWIKPLAWLKIGTNLGKDAVTWYVNDQLACTKKGTGPNWSAHLVLSLSISDGSCNNQNRVPKGNELLWFKTEYVRVFENMSYRT